MKRWKSVGILQLQRRSPRGARLAVLGVIPKSNTAENKRSKSSRCRDRPGRKRRVKSMVLKSGKIIMKTYIGMMLGMKLLQAATESGYPQSWACLDRHADSLCCSAPGLTTSSGHTVVVTITPNWAGTCCRDASIIKTNQSDLYGRRVFDCVSTVGPWTNRSEEILYTRILGLPG